MTIALSKRIINAEARQHNKETFSIAAVPLGCSVLNHTLNVSKYLNLSHKRIDTFGNDLSVNDGDKGISKRSGKVERLVLFTVSAHSVDKYLFILKCLFDIFIFYLSF